MNKIIHLPSSKKHNTYISQSIQTAPRYYIPTHSLKNLQPPLYIPTLQQPYDPSPPHPCSSITRAQYAWHRKEKTSTLAYTKHARKKTHKEEKKVARRRSRKKAATRERYCILYWRARARVPLYLSFCISKAQSRWGVNSEARARRPDTKAYVREGKKGIYIYVWVCMEAQVGEWEIEKKRRIRLAGKIFSPRLFVNMCRACVNTRDSPFLFSAWGGFWEWLVCGCWFNWWVGLSGFEKEMCLGCLNKKWYLIYTN